MARRKKAEELAKQRAEREAQQTKAEQERVQRSVAGVNHLEIPAELAFILSKVNGKCQAPVVRSAVVIVMELL